MIPRGLPKNSTIYSETYACRTILLFTRVIDGEIVLVLFYKYKALPFGNCQTPRKS